MVASLVHIAVCSNRFERDIIGLVLGSQTNENLFNLLLNNYVRTAWFSITDY